MDKRTVLIIKRMFLWNKRFNIMGDSNNFGYLFMVDFTKTLPKKCNYFSFIYYRPYIK